ncbi:kinesin-like protein KIF26B isoform X3 [Branchiostoma lanceolatum]|uniref:kinesin-like protein KIF26B isoform X3 n=1 Tax=Branchiostoma lanceolatum TaxID=7740 RepID=UPI003456B4D5
MASATTCASQRSLLTETLRALEYILQDTPVTREDTGLPSGGQTGASSHVRPLDSPLQDSDMSASLAEKLQIPDGLQKGWSADHCDTCATNLDQLKQDAIAMVQSLDEAQSNPGSAPLGNLSSIVGSRNIAALQRGGHLPTLNPSSHHRGAPGRHGQGKPPYPSHSMLPVRTSASAVAAHAQQLLEDNWGVSKHGFQHPHLSQTQPGSSRSSVSDIPTRSVAERSVASSRIYPTPSSTAGSAGGTSAAASFFARAAQKLNLASKKKKKHAPEPQPELPVFPTNFSDLLKASPPSVPPCFLRTSSKRDNLGVGKVKVMLRVCPTGEDIANSSLMVDQRRKQVTLYDPSLNGVSHRRMAVAAPKMFAFDAIFSEDASQVEVCSSALSDILQSVVGGADGCVFCYGHSKLGKTYTMAGNDDSSQSLGVIPCSIAWLFRLINEQKQKTGARFSVRVSAVEVYGKQENLRDLLSEQATGSTGSNGTSPGVYLCEDPVFGIQLQNQSELRAPTAEKAAFYLDAALAARSTARTPTTDIGLQPQEEPEEENRNSHFLFTLHIYQYRIDKSGKGGVAGGRSRLHLIDLGSGEKSSGKATGSVALTLSALGNVILALVNGAKHVPYRESKITRLLSESLGNLNCRTTMLAHVSPKAAHYSETLQTVQLASRIHRMRKKKAKYSSSSGGESSCEEGRIRRPHFRPSRPLISETVREDAATTGLGISDKDDVSSSEQSCDTVIYVGPNGAVLSDRELTDNEGPPETVRIVRRDYKQQRKECQIVEEDCETESKATPLSSSPLFSPDTENRRNLYIEEENKENEPSQVVYDKPAEDRMEQESAREQQDVVLEPITDNGSDYDFVCEDGEAERDLRPEESAPAPQSNLEEEELPPLDLPEPTSSLPEPLSEATEFLDSLLKNEDLFTSSESISNVQHSGEQTLSSLDDGSEYKSNSVLLNGNVHQYYSIVPTFEDESDDEGFTPPTKQQPTKDKKAAESDANSLTETLAQLEAFLTKEDLMEEALQPQNEEASAPKPVPSPRKTSNKPKPVPPPRTITLQNRPPDLSFPKPPDLPVPPEPQSSKRVESRNNKASPPANPHDLVFKSSDLPMRLEDDRCSLDSISINSLLDGTEDVKDEGRTSPDGELERFPFEDDIPLDATTDILGRKFDGAPTRPPDLISDLGDADDLQKFDKKDRPISGVSEDSVSSTKVVLPESRPLSMLSQDSIELYVPPPPPNAQVSLRATYTPPTNVTALTKEKLEALDDASISLSERRPSENSSSNKSNKSMGNTRQNMRLGKRTSSSSSLRSTGSHSSHSRNHHATSQSSKLSSAHRTELKSNISVHSRITPKSVNALSRSQAGSTGSVRPSEASICRVPSSSSLSKQSVRSNRTRELALTRTASDGSNSDGARSTASERLPGSRPVMRPRGSSASCSLPASPTKLTKLARPSPAGLAREDSRPNTPPSKIPGKPSPPPKPSQLPKPSSGSSPVSWVPCSTSSSRSAAKSAPKAEQKPPKPPRISSLGDARLRSGSASSKASMSSAREAVSAKNRIPSRSASTNGLSAGNVSAKPAKAGSKLPVPSSARSGKPLPSSSSKSSLQSFQPSNRSAQQPGGKAGSSSGKASAASGRTGQKATQALQSRAANLPSRKDSASKVNNTRVSELSKESPAKIRLSTDSDSGNDSGIQIGDEKSPKPMNHLISPYSTVTAPRPSHRSSSGHGSDASSILSGDIPPPMKPSVLNSASGASSGYESMIRDSEATGSASSNHDSMSESSSGRIKTSRNLKKRLAQGSRNRRMVPPRPSDSPSLSRKALGSPKWVDVCPGERPPHDAVELKVYEVDDIERLAKRRLDGVEGGTQFNAKTRAMERRNAKVTELRRRQQELKEELSLAKKRLMIDSKKWNFDCKVEEEMDWEDPNYVEALEDETERLEKRVNVCKSHIMMVTCFDVKI